MEKSDLSYGSGNPFKKSFLAIAATACMLEGFPPFSSLPPEKPLKPCLRCGTKHNHNNAFCNAECCKLHKKGIPYEPS